MEAAENTRMTSPVHLRLDKDDPTLEEYLKIPFGDLWTVVVGERAGLGKIINSFYVDHSGLSWYGFLADDVVPETSEWDRQLIAEAGNDNLAHAFDGKHGKNFATHFVLGGGLVESIGWLALPELKRIYIDTIWNDIAKARKVRKYRPDVRLIHHHFSNGLAKRDETYLKPHNAQDRLVYIKWQREQHAGH